MQVKELNKKDEIDQTFAVMSQIYDDLDQDSYTENVLIMMQNGYKMAAIFEDNDVNNGECIGVTGIRISKRMQYKRILEIEDFMTSREKRGIGAGKMLIRWVEWQAMNFDCSRINCYLESKRIESHKILSRENFLMDGFKFYK